MYHLYLVKVELEDTIEEYFKVFENDNQLSDFLFEKYKDEAVERIATRLVDEVDKFQVFVKYKGDLQ